MHGILKSHENQLVRDRKIRESELKAGIHHARLRRFAGILKGKRVVNFGPKDGQVVPLELEKEEIRMAKHGEARKRYRHEMEVEEQLRRRRRLLRDDQARANRQAARQAADEEARPENYPKGGKKRKRKTRRKIKHKKRKTRRKKKIKRRKKRTRRR